MEQKQAACKLQINDIQAAQQLEDGSIVTPYGAIQRANVIAVVVHASDSLVLDDGTGSILLRFHDAPVQIGDVVLCIGKPQRFQQEWYLVPELLRKVDSAWLSVRKKELGLRAPVPSTPHAAPSVALVDETLENPLETRVVCMIRQEDAGEGADEGKIITAMSHPMTEKLIQKLILRGDIFYIKPGRLKVLE